MIQGPLGGSAEGDHALLVAFADDGDDAECGLAVGDAEGADLAGAEAAGVHEFEDGPVPEPERQRRGCVGAGLVGGPWGGEEGADVVVGEEAGESFPLGGSFEPLGGVFVELAFGVEESEQHADGGEVPRDGG